MKKVVALLLIFLLAIPSVFVSADDYDLVLEASKSPVELGETFNVTVTLPEMNGVNSISFKVIADGLAFISPASSDIVLDDTIKWNMAIADAKPEYIVFNYSIVPDISKSGSLVLATIPFTVVDDVEAKSYGIRIFEAEVGTGAPVVVTNVPNKRINVYVNGTVTPVAPSAPAAPTVAFAGTDYVELAAISGAEYKTEDGAWQDSPRFENLEAGKAYKFYARIKASGNVPASDLSPALEYFLKSIQAAPAKPEVKTKTATSVTLKEIAGALYRVDDGEWQESTEFTGLTTGQTYKFYAKYPETETKFESAQSEARSVKLSDGAGGGGGGGGGSDEEPTVEPEKPETPNEDVNDKPEKELVDKKVEITSVDGNYGAVSVNGQIVEAEISATGNENAEYGKEYTYSANAEAEEFEISVIGAGVTDDNKDSIVAFIKNADGTITPVSKTRVSDDGEITFVTDKASGEFYVVNNAVSFNDKADIPDWSKSYINALSARGIINGDGGNFAPNRNITRAELAAILVRAFGLEGSADNMAFSDVASDAWYHGVVAAAYANGIINGTSDTTFAPDAPVTREQMATMLSRVATNQTITLPNAKEYEGFADEASFGSYAVEHIEKLYSAGIINGKDAGNFDALGKATRAEVSKVVWGIFDLSY